MSDFKVVRLEWAYGVLAKEYPSQYHQRWAQPSGFVVTSQAATYFDISQKQAILRGKPIGEVLAEFFDAMVTIRNKGGNICAHHLEFDASIIDIELQRASFGTKRRELWGEFVAHKGFCTMNKHLGHWVCQQKGHPGSRPVAAKDLQSRLVPRLSCGGNEATKLWHIVKALREQIRAHEHAEK